MAPPVSRVMAQLKLQLEELEPHVALHLSRGESFQVVLYLDAEGKLGRAKWTGTGRQFDKRDRPPITSLS